MTDHQCVQSDCTPQPEPVDYCAYFLECLIVSVVTCLKENIYEELFSKMR